MLSDRKIKDIANVKSWDAVFIKEFDTEWDKAVRNIRHGSARYKIDLGKIRLAQEVPKCKSGV